jgi:Fe-S-cluster containining protein
VVLNFHEWLKIVKSYGVELTVSGLDTLFIKRRSDGSCVFLCNYSDSYACGLQYMKPKACQLWPFKILSQPRYGYANDAAYHCGGQNVFIYVDSMCNGLRHGTPTWEFANLTLREFTEIAMGLRREQHKTTASIGLPKPLATLRNPYARGMF